MIPVTISWKIQIHAGLIFSSGPLKMAFFVFLFVHLFLKVTHNKYEEGYLVRRLELENVYWVEILGNC